jgi:hypothetical protein
MGQTALSLSAAHSFSRKPDFDDEGGNAGGADMSANLSPICVHVCDPIVRR